MDKVTFFKGYPFTPGQKLCIEDGPRKGDWIVKAVHERKVDLRCPISGVEVSWNHFCYVTDERKTTFPTCKK